MQRTHFRPFVCLPAVLVLFAPASAAPQQAGMLVLEAPSSVETMALGNAPYLFSSSPTHLFEAPSEIGRAEGVAASFQRYGGAGTLLSVAGAGDLLGGGFALGLQYMRYSPADGFPAERDMQSVAFEDGPVGVTELVASVGYAHDLFGFEVGGGVKYTEENADAAHDRGVAFDFGISRGIGPVRLAFTGRNFGKDPELAPGPEGPEPVGLELPRQLVAGVSLRQFQLGPLDMFATSQVTRRRDGQYIPAGGIELSYWPVVGYTFRLRGGLQRVVDDERSPFTLGAGFTADHITLEYAFQAFDEHAGAHRLGLRWN
ncbi:MAG: hypothetical protein R3195_10770 [Gemmatimonadota bacterium]|nr:hypothetical protein [Gemmatimonadota bacterium]